MSDMVFREYLISKCEKLKKPQERMIYNTKNKKVAVLVEPREHEFLELVVRNVATILDDSWNIQIFTSNPEWCMKIFPDWRIKFVKLEFDNCTREQYSGLLMSKQFWELIHEEHILIFQTDCIFFKKGIDAFLEYDYIGPNYYAQQHVTPEGRGIQGGVSLRRRSAMIDCIENVTYDIINKYRKEKGFPIMNDVIEDVYFTHACEILGKNVATREINKSFGIECAYDYTINTHCHHGVNKPYFSIQDAMRLLANS